MDACSDDSCPVSPQRAIIRCLSDIIGDSLTRYESKSDNIADDRDHRCHTKDNGEGTDQPKNSNGLLIIEVLVKVMAIVCQWDQSSNDPIEKCYA